MTIRESLHKYLEPHWEVDLATIDFILRSHGVNKSRGYISKILALMVNAGQATSRISNDDTCVLYRRIGVGQ